ncbi:hypothetical protein ACSYAY_07265 [Leptospirillum ferriphilum]|uniref:Uncharacterized protein n=2 Tax=Leptospirillum TaxID=179 RepID=A0A094WEU7_9BACT|nr:hypothetical protein [Leptospirillum ferriphilum]EDZ40256.1 MAG: Protein of unknown function [Leptospirillum sp. Group II '5-way CG']KGA94167.1 hypothetical protein LptCag_0793 [Leptospirillum ferriphilum]
MDSKVTDRIGTMILEMFRSGMCLFSVRSPGSVAELYGGEARKVDVSGTSLTIEREAWHLHCRLETVETVVFDLSPKENGGIRMAVVFQDKHQVPVLRAAWLPRLMPDTPSPPEQFWAFTQRYIDLPVVVDARNRQLVSPGSGQGDSSE